ncbi:hypothetical protein ON010_g18990 [Phytophthora cinnamomi]|nr:hypothetical protein ON010_g18990 [Phytophthora cinnamomi]
MRPSLGDLPAENDGGGSPRAEALDVRVPAAADVRGPAGAAATDAAGRARHQTPALRAARPAPHQSLLGRLQRASEPNQHQQKQFVELHAPF